MALCNEVFVCTKPALSVVGALEFENDAQRLGAACRRWVINEADSYAMEHALRLRESGVVERVTCITAASVENPDFLSWYMALGADRAIRIVMPEDVDLDEVVTGTVLGMAIARMEGQLVFAAQRSDDGGSGIVPVATANAMGAAYLSNVAVVTLSDNGVVEIERKLEGGNKQVWAASLPAVVGIEPGSILPRYVSVAGLLLARRRTVEQMSIESIGLDVDSLRQPRAVQRLAVPRVRPKKTVALTGGSAADRLKMMMSGGAGDKKEKRVLKGSPDQLAGDVMKLLREKQFLSRDGR